MWYLAGLLAYSLLVAFPSLLKQWLEEQTVDRVYSYGDSAGFQPDFPFNPDLTSGTKSVAKVQGSFSNTKYFNAQ